MVLARPNNGYSASVVFDASDLNWKKSSPQVSDDADRWDGVDLDVMRNEPPEIVRMVVSASSLIR